MSFLVANLPSVHCFVRREFLYDFKRGHGEFEACYWVTVKSIQGQALRWEAFLPRYGALYDKLPLSAFVSRDHDMDPGQFLPLDALQIWNCNSYDITVIKKRLLEGLSCRFIAKNKQWYQGEYLFTIDHAQPDSNIAPTMFAEEIMDHKSYNIIRMDNGQFAAQPNNRTIFIDPSSKPRELAYPDFEVATVKYSVERDLKWSCGDNSQFTYEEYQERDAAMHPPAHTAL